MFAMDFGALPPEINSARMYAGAGSGPLLAAASAWETLATELGNAASSYSSVISGLASGPWLGQGSASMAAAAAPYAAWMSTTAGQAEQTANQARAAAAAYEAAFAMTVPPPVIAANRALLMALVATNVLGQNTPAIAATEAQYGEMWAQDAAAMYGYAGASAAATRVTPFSAPKPTTSGSGLAQTAAVAQSTGSGAGTGVQSALSQVMSTVPGTLQGLASPASSAPVLAGTTSANPFAAGSNTSTQGMAGMLNLLDGQTGSAAGTFLNSTFFNGFASGNWLNPASISPAVTSALADVGFLSVLGPGGAALNPAQLMTSLQPAVGLPGLAGLGLPGLGGSAPAAVSAGLGRATLVGSLSVPQSWATAAPVPAPPATASLVSSWTAASGTGATGTAGMPGMPGMPMVGAGGRGIGFAAPRYGFRPTVMAQPPAAG
jgi:PPE-repeat protein